MRNPGRFHEYYDKGLLIRVDTPWGVVTRVRSPLRKTSRGRMHGGVHWEARHGKRDFSARTPESAIEWLKSETGLNPRRSRTWPADEIMAEVVGFGGRLMPRSVAYGAMLADGFTSEESINFVLMLKKKPAGTEPQAETLNEWLGPRFSKPGGGANPLPPRSLDTMSKAIALSSPSGHMSKAASDRASKRLSLELFGPEGMPAPKGLEYAESEKLTKQAKDLRDLADRGMSTRKFRRQADMLEAKARELAREGNPRRSRTWPMDELMAEVVRLGGVRVTRALAYQLMTEYYGHPPGRSREFMLMLKRAPAGTELEVHSMSEYVEAIGEEAEAVPKSKRRNPALLSGLATGAGIGVGLTLGKRAMETLPGTKRSPGARNPIGRSALKLGYIVKYTGPTGVSFSGRIQGFEEGNVRLDHISSMTGERLFPGRLGGLAAIPLQRVERVLAKSEKSWVNRLAGGASGNPQPPTFYDLSITPEGQQAFDKAWDRYLELHPETYTYGGTSRLDDAQRYAMGRFRAWCRKTHPGVQNPAIGNPRLSHLKRVQYAARALGLHGKVSQQAGRRGYLYQPPKAKGWLDIGLNADQAISMLSEMTRLESIKPGVLNPDPGIRLVLGITGTGRNRVSETQSVMFLKSRWTAAQAKTWLREHDYKAPAVDKGGPRARYYRFRQQAPGKYKTLRTITPGGRSNPAATAGGWVVAEIDLQGKERVLSSRVCRTKREATVAKNRLEDINQLAHYVVKKAGSPPARHAPGHGRSNPAAPGGWDVLEVGPHGRETLMVAGPYRPKREAIARKQRLERVYPRRHFIVRKTEYSPTRRRNPDSYPDSESEAADLYETFHGRSPEQVTVVPEDEQYHEWLTELGTLSEIKVRTESGYDADISFSGDNVILSSSEDGRQLYLVGGNQALDLAGLHMNGKWRKDLMNIGEVRQITYRTGKNFDNFEAIDYYHNLGEESGALPVLVFDTLNDQLRLAGGQYAVKQEGIVN